MAGNKEHTIFSQGDLFERGFPVMEEIRRKGKLCDVTLKVSMFVLACGPSTTLSSCWDQQASEGYHGRFLVGDAMMHGTQLFA